MLGLPQVAVNRICRTIAFLNKWNIVVSLILAKGKFNRASALNPGVKARNRARITYRRMTTMMVLKEKQADQYASAEGEDLLKGAFGAYPDRVEDDDEDDFEDDDEDEEKMTTTTTI